MADLTPMQRVVLEGLMKTVVREGQAVTAREIADHLGAGWYPAPVSGALYKLGQKKLARRVGWAGTARTWEPV